MTPALGLPRPHPTGTRMLGLGAFRPRRVVGNDEVCARLDVDADWVLARSGISTRRVAGPDESIVDMGVASARGALAAAGASAGDVDVTLVATMSQDTSCPQASARIAAQLGAPGPAMDVGAACAGFCYSLELASAMVRAGSAGLVLRTGRAPAARRSHLTMDRRALE